MRRKTIRFFMALSLILLLAEVAYAKQSEVIPRFLLGTWIISNDTSDDTYSGTVGQVTFLEDGSLTIDSGRFAAAGLVAESEDVSCHIPLSPILVKSLGKSSFAKQFLHISWFGKMRGGGGTYPQDSVVTIIEHLSNKITMIGSGGCGAQGALKISHLQKMK